MTKIVFCPIALQHLDAIYSAKQPELFAGTKYDKPVFYPINAVLANELYKDDELKIVLIKTKDASRPDFEKTCTENQEKYLTEIKEICSLTGARSNADNPIIIESEFKETKDIFEKRFMEFFDVLEKDTEIYADTTFGSRVFSMIMMNVIEFAEKFFDADLKSVVYGKTSFIDDPENPGKKTPTQGTVYDISALCLMTNLTHVLKADSGEKAINAFKAFLND